MSAPESFIEHVRCQLVNPRRNVRRALERIESPDASKPGPAYFLSEALEVIEDLEAFVRAASERTVHRCSCGHTHYRHGDEA